MTRIYIKALWIFTVTFAIGIVLRHFFQFIGDEAVLKIIFMSFLAISFSYHIYSYGKGKWKLFMKINWKPEYWIYVLILIALFATNNYFQTLYADNDYFYKTLRSGSDIYIWSYIVSSASEEIIYRGFLQNFINENTLSKYSAISKGNVFASFLFLLTHFGFFMVMDTFFAITSLANVVIFSLISGYLYDKTKNIFIPVILHIFINMLHIAIHLYF